VHHSNGCAAGPEPLQSSVLSYDQFSVTWKPYVRNLRWRWQQWRLELDADVVGTRAGTEKMKPLEFGRSMLQAVFHCQYDAITSHNNWTSHKKAMHASACYIAGTCCQHHWGSEGLLWKPSAGGGLLISTQGQYTAEWQVTTRVCSNQ
jgi:hypothetical protein